MSALTFAFVLHVILTSWCPKISMFQSGKDIVEVHHINDLSCYMVIDHKTEPFKVY